jgi:hypothetical protein
MITLCVVGWLIYMVFGVSVLGHLCYKYLDDDKMCVDCIHYVLSMFWAFLPFTLLLDLRG